MKSELKGQQAEDYIILIHKFGYENLGRDISEFDLFEYLYKAGYIQTDIRVWSHVIHVMNETFHVGTNKELIYKSEAYYRYLEYLEMKAADKSSDETRILSITAIVITVVLASIQIWVELTKQS